MLSSVGILILVYQRAAFDIVFGILVLIFSIALLTGAIIAQFFYSNQYRKAKLQLDFISRVSHELRTPLTSIRMFVDTLQSNSMDDPDEAAMCLGIISTETSRLTSMIERLLNWGRMESGRRIFELHPESVDTLVGESLALAEPQLKASGLHLDLQLPSPSPMVAADREAIVEALLNLLNNALKYGASGARVCIRVRQERRKVFIDVEDDGPGIPRNEHGRIFEKFYRGKSLNGSIQGSGLGLAMARLVVKAHHGAISLRSTPGQGACFTIELPALSSSRQASEVPSG